jgi:photosystem II stability/assembly factor-like uncharacterized protein
MIDHRLYVGTIGEGLFRSLDHGETFRRACDGVFVECDVRAIAVHPRRPEVLYLGTEVGLYVSEDGADNWQLLPAPLEGLQVWSLCLTPARPDRLIAGTCPSAVYLSEDGGKTWRAAAVKMIRDCPRIMHTRVTCITADPDNPDRLWAGVEIDGLHLSEDGGRTWTPTSGEGLTSRDIHGLVVQPARGGRKRLLATTNNDLSLSDDGGRTWRAAGMKGPLPWAYCRALTARLDDPDALLLGGGDAPPGCEGLVARSLDGGSTWTPAAMPGRANSTMWSFACHGADPRLIYSASVSGQVFRSTDGGASWSKIGRDFGEIRALAWTPVLG